MVRTSMDIPDHLRVACGWPDELGVNDEAKQYAPRYVSQVGQAGVGCLSDKNRQGAGSAR